MLRRCVMGVLVVLLATISVPAAGELSRPDQQCVNNLNSRLRELNRTIQRETDRCIKDFNRGTRFSNDDPMPVTDIPACVAADRRGRVAKAIRAVERQYERRCARVAPALVPVLGGDASTIVGAVNDNGDAVVSLVYGAGDSSSGVSRVADAEVDGCRAGVTEGLHLCQDAIVVGYQRCVETALKARKAPALEGATSVADLSVCLGWDPDGRVARHCDTVEDADEIRSALAKSCPIEEVNLASAFPGCGATTHEAVYECLKPQAACSVCQKLRAAGGLTPNCDAFDDGLDNLSCGCGDGVPTPAEECDDGNNVSGDGCSAACAVEFCGDGIANDGDAEECDGADATACGDGLCSDECACGSQVFVTSSVHTGDLGGRAGANATCQDLATAAGLTGEFKAWLSIVGDHAAGHMNQRANPYVLVDGSEVASDFSDLSDWSIAAPISLDETGTTVLDSGTHHVWTHTEGNGEAVPGDPCNAWTSSASTRFAVYGLATAATSSWTRSAYLNCDMPGRLYCIQQ